MPESEEQQQPLPKVEFSDFGKALAEKVKKKGAITFAEYMGECVNEYYSTRRPFGQQGDFITAPEISQMFGEMIGVWFADIWMQMGRPKKARIVELGPGNGTLAADLMRAIGTWPDCKAAMVLSLIEISPVLRGNQLEKLKQYSPAFYDTLDDVPDDMPTFFIANEFVDALPIRQYIRRNKKWHEKMVGFNDETGEFFFALKEEPSEPVIPQLYPKPMDRDTLEINEGGRQIAAAIGKRIEKNGGASLIIDYGELKPFYGDTIESFKRHKRVDPMRNPGGQDVTANVDFSALVEAAARYVNVAPLVTQGEFLERMGIMERCEVICKTATPEQRGAARLAVRRLINPTEMGRLFKVLGFTAKGNVIPAGFTDDHQIHHDQP